MACSRPNRSMALVISCACVAMALCAAVPAALASDPPRVADLSFTVSDPLDSSLLDNGGISTNTSGPHWLNENGLVVLTTQYLNVYLWDSLTGSVDHVYPTVYSALSSYGINRHGSISCTDSMRDWPYSSVATRFDRLPDGSYSGTVLPNPNPYGSNDYGAKSISDTGWIVGMGGYSGQFPYRWSPDGSGDWVSEGQHQATDCDNRGLASSDTIDGGGKAEEWTTSVGFVRLPMPPWGVLSNAHDINGRGVAVGVVTDGNPTGSLIRWPTYSTYDLLPFPNAGDAAMYSPSIADNGIIVASITDSVRAGGYWSLWVWDPVSLEPFYLDDLVDPAGNPQGYEFHWNTPVYGTASNAAYTRILAVGYLLVANQHDYVVLTAITRGLTKEADFEAGNLAAFDLAGGGTAMIVDDPYTPGNHVLELDGDASVSQPVSMLETPHDLVFKAHANQAAGMLTVSIDGQVVGHFPGKRLMQPSMKPVSIRLTQSSLLGKDGVTLEFSWQGAAGEQILIDDIDFGKGAHTAPPWPDWH